MGSVVIIADDDVAQYGELGVRFNNLRDLYNCIRDAINQSKDMGHCT